MLVPRLIALISCLLIPYASIFAKSAEAPSPYNHYILALDLGFSSTASMENSTSFPLGYSTFSYTPNDITPNPLRFGVAVRKRLNLSPINAIEMGLSYHKISSINLNGLLEQGISSPLYPFTYAYSIDSSQLLGEAKLLHQWHDVFYPYLIAGIGAGFNKASNYSTSVPDYLTITPVYTQNSTTAFSYTLGFGVDILKLQSLAIGVGYRFSDLGSVELGNGTIRNREIGTPLKQSHLYLNTALLELSCFF